MAKQEYVQVWKADVKCEIPEELHAELIHNSEAWAADFYDTLMSILRTSSYEFKLTFHPASALWYASLMCLESKNLLEIGLRLRAGGQTPDVALAALAWKLDVCKLGTWHEKSKKSKESNRVV